MSTKVEEERYFLTKIHQLNLPAHEALNALEPPRAGLLLPNAPEPWRVFTPAKRITHHTHHGRKYADTGLPG